MWGLGPGRPGDYVPQVDSWSVLTCLGTLRVPAGKAGQNLVSLGKYFPKFPNFYRDKISHFGDIFPNMVP